MKRFMQTVAMAIIAMAFITGCKSEVKTEQVIDTGEVKEKVTKRVGMVVKIREDKIEEYKKLHAPDNPGVRDLLTKYNMQNFSIFLHRFDDGSYYEFGYYEYVGDNFEEDMANLAKEPRNIEWMEICDPMQVPLEGYEGWADMEQVYYNE